MPDGERGASAALAAAHIGVSAVTFGKLLNTGIIKRQPRNVGYDLTVVRMARLRQLEAIAAGRSGADGGVLLARERALLTREKRESAALKNQDARGELVHLSLIRTTLGELFGNMREVVLGTAGVISDAIAAHPMDRAAIHQIIDGRLREMLAELSAGGVLERSRSQRRADRRRIAADAIEERVGA